MGADQGEHERPHRNRCACGGDECDGWEPIGGNFTGTFEGNGYAIYNLYINYSASADRLFAGLFGVSERGSKIRNLGLTGEHMLVKGENTSSSSGPEISVGSLVGLVQSGSAIRNCYATGNVKSTCPDVANAGGLAGSNFGGLIENCYATGNATASGVSTSNLRSGGLVGRASPPNIKNCYATGSATSSGTGSPTLHSGGLIGHSDPGTIENSYRLSTATITGGTPNSLGTAASDTQLKALTAASSSWSSLDWYFGTNAQLPALQAFMFWRARKQVRGELLRGQPTAQASLLVYAFVQLHFGGREEFYFDRGGGACGSDEAGLCAYEHLGGAFGLGHGGRFGFGRRGDDHL